ncbi:hypothetical protein BDR26DRAFT_114890 [Obelidium mucronatum]|nr:hypothetical protein BDR26DRAFT_114890 [Obelidium mucronatum]
MFWWWQQKEPLNDEEAVKLGFKDGAEKKAAYARVDEQLVNPYQASLATIIQNSPSDDKRMCLLAFNDNKLDRAIACLTATEMLAQGVVVVTTAPLGPGFAEAECLAGTNVLKALEDPDQFGSLTDVEKEAYKRYKDAPAVFLLSNESMGNSSFRNLHREHNLAGNRFASVRIGEFDAERVADYHNLNRAPGEPSMTEKEATEAIEEAKRVDHRFDNLFVATDGSERRNKKAAEDLTKEVSQMVAQEIDQNAVNALNQFDVFISYQ